VVNRDCLPKSGAKNDRDALVEEGGRLVRLMAVPEGVETFEIRFAEP
jgi:hypothetical protein